MKQTIEEKMKQPLEKDYQLGDIGTSTQYKKDLEKYIDQQAKEIEELKKAYNTEWEAHKESKDKNANYRVQENKQDNKIRNLKAVVTFLNTMIKDKLSHGIQSTLIVKDALE